ncbi:Phosphoribosylglycinamide formyltransferase [Burkholderiales bacterium 8X]|nr:Phosphoribosylglycinamide formyltransferase [Burkholderiales bacterium 8X]
MKNIAILISGLGSNMSAVVRAAERDAWHDRIGARVSIVISNKPGAAGLKFAEDNGIPTAVVPHQDFPSREEFDSALAQVIDAHSPALVLLAGFMRVLTPAFVERYQGRLLNIHPSLLPAFPGLDTHRRAIEAGCRFAGATVHQVTAELDHGPIVAQAIVPVLPDDSADTLRRRVLAVEHGLYPRAVFDWLRAR